MRFLRWAAYAALAVALGLSVAWMERTFSIPKAIVQIGWLVALMAALGFAAWAAWRYYRALRDEDDWD